MRKMLFLLFVSIALSWQCQVVSAQSESSRPRPTARKRRALSPDQERMRKEVMQLREEREKKNRENFKKMRQAKRDERDKARRPRDFGVGSEKQLAVLEKKLTHETTKHKERMAKLHRMRELATKKRSGDLIKRIDRLVLREGQRHSRKFGRMQSQSRRLKRGGSRERKDPRAGIRPGRRDVRPPVNIRPDDLRRRPPSKQNTEKTGSKP